MALKYLGYVQVKGMDKSEFQRTFQRSDELMIDWEVKGCEHLGKICSPWHVCSLDFKSS